MHDPRRGAASGALGKITKIPGLGNLGNMPATAAIVAHSSSNPLSGWLPFWHDQTDYWSLPMIAKRPT
jgi:hypothetical protein